MNSKERVLAAIKRQPTDRVPTDFQAEAPTLEAIYRHTGSRDLDALLDRFDVDIRHIDAIWPKDRQFDDYYQNPWGERFVVKQTDFGPISEHILGPLADARSLEDLKNFPWPTVDMLDYSAIPALCDKYEGRAVGYGFADFWIRPSLVRGMENFLSDLVVHPDYCHFLADLFTTFYIEDYRRAFEASGGRIDIFQVYTDLGTQRGPLISKKMFREFVRPYLKRFADAVHEMGAFLFFHSCGQVRSFIGELIESGVDIINPIQPCAPEMSPEELHKEFGDRVCFHGGISVQGVLSNGTPDDVRREVERYKRAFEHRGYIVSASHFYQLDNKIENIFAVYQS